nr:hypothetical protein [Tanacetum cinerariifolium]
MSDMTALLNNLSYIPSNNEHNEPTQGDIGETSNKPTQAIRNEFEELYANANEELYPGCDYVSRLDFTAKFTYFKLKGKENKYLDFCPVCNTSRWQDSNTPGKKVPKKVLRYFLIIPRLQRLYKSSHTAKEMICHATGKYTEPSKMQHPVDGRAWKKFDTIYLDFAKEPRNVRLGLAADGFNPFGNLSQAYSMWPVILTTYNLPSWLCMKESSFMLTLLIPGPKSPGKDIYVYLRPLIEDLKARQDLQRLGIRSGLWLGQTKIRKCLKPQAAYSFTPGNRKKFCQFIKGVKLPDGLGSCFNHKVTNKDTNITGLKSHDCHIMMQRLLPYGLQQYFPDKIAKPIIELCSLFKQICSATLMKDDMLKAQIKVVDILCDLELIYHPALFDIMIHLVIHLPLEDLKGGPIRPQWMFPFERYMKKLKGYDVTTKFNRPDHNVDPLPNISVLGVPIDNDKDTKVSTTSELFALACRPTWSPISLQEILEFKYLLFKVVLFRVKWFDTRNQGRKVKCLVLRNNMRQIDCRGEALKMINTFSEQKSNKSSTLKIRPNPTGRSSNMLIMKIFPTGDLIMVEDDPDIIYFDNSSDLPLSASLNDLDNATLHIDGQSTEVDTPPDIIDVPDEDDDIIDDEDALPYDLADFDDEDLINVDDDGVDKVYSSEEED